MFQPHQVQGELPDYDLKEFQETGLLVTDCSFTPKVDFREKLGHAKGAQASGTNGDFSQPVQVLVRNQGLDIELKGEIVPDAAGKAVGFANVYPGQSTTCVHFAAGGDSIHGYTRDDAKLLMVKEVKRELNNENVPVVTVPMTYYPFIAAPIAA